MFRYLFPLFIAVPLLEAWLLIKVGGVIGAGSTVLLIVLTAIIGVFCLRRQGASTLNRIHHNLYNGTLPAIELVEGALLVVAGALLLTPGFATDAAGFLLLWPWARKLMILRLRDKLLTPFVVKTEQMTPSDNAQNDAHIEVDVLTAASRRTTKRPEHSGDIIDAEYTRDD
jgi:UPF0716 protein FxsA